MTLGSIIFNEDRLINRIYNHQLLNIIESHCLLFTNKSIKNISSKFYRIITNSKLQNDISFIALIIIVKYESINLIIYQQTINLRFTTLCNSAGHKPKDLTNFASILPEGDPWSSSLQPALIQPNSNKEGISALFAQNKCSSIFEVASTSNHYTSRRDSKVKIQCLSIDLGTYSNSNRKTRYFVKTNVE